VTNGRVVKGVNFVALRDAGDPVEIARRYDEQGADELTFLDITASSDNRGLILHIIEKWRRRCSFLSPWAAACVPSTTCGACSMPVPNKVGINTAAVENPQLVADASSRFGSQCIVVAIDAKQVSVCG